MLSCASNKKNHEWAVLQDITSDSPINGVAAEKTPLSSAIKYTALPKRTPGPGEALLRGHVKILLAKVEEEAGLVNKLSNRLSAPFFPGSGPQISTICRVKDGRKQEASVDLQTVAESVKRDESPGFQECVISRALLFDLFDSPNTPEVSDVSTIAFTSSCDQNWSIQANARAVEDKEIKLPESTGKHSRFIYNRDDEIEEEEEIGGARKAVSPSVMLLKGLPLPEGKHHSISVDLTAPLFIIPHVLL